MQCFKCFEFNHIIKSCNKKQCCNKCADKHHMKRCTLSLNKKQCANCNENHKLWRCTCFKWKQQMMQSSKIYRNKSARYSETFRNNHTFLILFLNAESSMNLSSLDSTNLLKSMNFSILMNFLSSRNIKMMISWSHQGKKMLWQMIKVKKRWVK
jgi:hypothetical protein